MNNRQATLLLVVVIIIWGVNWTVTKIIVTVMQPIWATAIRAGIATIILFGLQICTGKLIIPRKHDLPLISVVAIFHMVLFAIFMAIGLQYISVGRSVVLGYTTPLWVAPCAWIFLHEPMPPLKILGILIGLSGLVVLLNPTNLNWNDSQALIGNGLLLIAAICWAVSILCIKAFTWHSTPYQISPWQNLLATIIMIIFAFILEGELQVTITTSLVFAMAYNAILSTAFGFWAITTVNTHFTATTLSLALLATPIVGILSSLFMLGETIDLPLIIASSLILTGIGIGTIDWNKNKFLKNI